MGKYIKLKCNIKIDNLLIEINIDHWNESPNDHKIEYLKEAIKEYFEDNSDEIIGRIINQNNKLINHNL